MTKTLSLNRRRFIEMAGAALLMGCGQSPSGIGSPLSQQSKQRAALLLPLSGSRATLGKQMAKAVWLVEDFSGATGRTQVLDAGETPQSASSATRKALADGATIIVGPLFRDQTPAVVEAAGDVPVLSLSNDTALAAQGAWVFGVTPAQSVAAVGTYARKTGARRLAMLETGSILDARAANAFKTNRTKTLPTVPASTSPSDMLAALRQSGGGPLPDVLYIPTAGKKALQQAVASVKTGVTTIGSLQWSGLPQSDLDRLDKACFTGPDPVRFNRLSAAFRAQLEEEMGVIAALAVDAVETAHASKGKAIGRGTEIEGLLGQTRLLPNGTCSRILAILRINGGDVVPVI